MPLVPIGLLTKHVTGMGQFSFLHSDNIKIAKVESNRKVVCKTAISQMMCSIYYIRSLASMHAK